MQIGVEGVALEPAIEPAQFLAAQVDQAWVPKSTSPNCCLGIHDMAPGTHRSDAGCGAPGESRLAAVMPM